MRGLGEVVGIGLVPNRMARAEEHARQIRIHADFAQLKDQRLLPST
jgi:hypothetical protein